MKQEAAMYCIDVILTDIMPKNVYRSNMAIMPQCSYLHSLFADHCFSKSKESFYHLLMRWTDGTLMINILAGRRHAFPPPLRAGNWI